jgi:hypothetical protein
VVALGFLFSGLILCQIAAWSWLRMHWEEPAAALILAGANLVIAAILGLIAAWSSPGRVEVEALAVRRRALDSIASGLAMTALVRQLLPLAIRLFRRR